jgi:tRNA pseudouridine38-40 synthase
MHIKTVSQVRQPPGVIQRRLNDLLPADIVILHLEQAPRNFHARHDALSRVYIYRISRRKQAFTKKYVWWIKDELDVQVMTRAAALLVGMHDFACFRAADRARPDESTIVVVEKAEIEIETEEDIILFRIEGSHFLWRMVRRVVGALVKVGTGDIREQDFGKLVDGRVDSRFDVAAWTAPASGLFLERVRYPNPNRNERTI